MKQGELVSIINQGFNAVSKDAFIPRRYILAVFKNIAKTLLGQQADRKQLFRLSKMFTVLNCVELEPVNIIACPLVQFRSCRSLMKTKKPLPDMIETKIGPVIILVQTLDGTKTFYQKSELEMSNQNKRRGADKFEGGYYYIINNDMYIPDIDIEIVRITLLTLDDEIECDTCNDGNCDSFWDRELIIPDKLLQIAVQQTIQQISLRFQLPKDENPDLDSNIKSQTT